MFFQLVWTSRRGKKRTAMLFAPSPEDALKQALQHIRGDVELTDMWTGESLI